MGRGTALSAPSPNDASGDRIACIVWVGFHLSPSDAVSVFQESTVVTILFNEPMTENDEQLPLIVAFRVAGKTVKISATWRNPYVYQFTAPGGHWNAGCKQCSGLIGYMLCKSNVDALLFEIILICLNVKKLSS